mgnify:FL=1
MLCTPLLFFVLLGIMSNIYRPYIYSHGIYDFHIADTFSDLLLVPTCFCFVCALEKEINVRIETGILAEVIVLVFVEVIDSPIDYYDALAAIISGIITTIAIRKVFPDWR